MRKKTKTQKNSFSQFLHWVRTHKLLAIAAVGVVLIFVVAGYWYSIVSQPMPELKIPPAPPPKPAAKHYSPLTGVEVKSESIAKRPVTAVMIENSPNARPQSGLKDAGIVYEAVAEGGITRFAALYQESQPNSIGPVRSLRPYYLDWIAGYNASVVHVGGSPDALREVRNGNYRDIDEFFNPATFWRATDRYAPHNVYTNFSRINKANKNKKYSSSNFSGFSRTDSKASSKPNAKKVTINLSSGLYNTSYTYDTKTNTYKRNLAGAPHRDREKGQIRPSVVIALKVSQSNGFYRNVKTIGSGEAIVFQNGRSIKATWNKTGKKSPITIKDSEGKDIKLNRGQTWIAAVPNGQGSVSWQ